MWWAKRSSPESNLAVEGQRLETGRTETFLIAHSLVLSLGMLYSYPQQQPVYVGCGV